VIDSAYASAADGGRWVEVDQLYALSGRSGR
jgi:hypothetical protein